MSIVIKRVYEPAVPADGYRVLVDRLWPRGIRKDALPLDLWAKELAPSTALRQWFGHAPSRWDAFRHRYAAELDELAPHWRPLVAQATRHTVTLLYAARDGDLNHAVVLQAYLQNWQRMHGPR
ncbi:MAG: DUF488 domain-containing protein [Rhodanobacter sp.]|jgi:uncharacterized protein YeaO (DUF488 family)|nr:DUF488 domain-containing protein [Rhodanobacter sp.]